MTNPQPNPRMYIGVLLNVSDFNRTICTHMGEYMQYIDISNTIRANVHSYFYAEHLPTYVPIDTYLGGVVAYRVNQETLPPGVREYILNKMADLQWVLHDYISLSVQSILGVNVCKENEYYYVLDGNGRLMVYVPVDHVALLQLGVATIPEASVVMACYQTLPLQKRLAYSKAIAEARS